MIDPRLEEFATDLQKTYIQAVREHGSGALAGAALGVDKSTINRAIQAVRRKAATKGYAPEFDMTRPAPDGFTIKGTSTYYDDEGKVRGQWVKTARDEAIQEELRRAAFEELSAELPRLPPVPPPAVSLARLCNVYTLTDSHVGAMAWHQEGGADWDLKIAERTLIGCFEKMLAASPNSRVCVVAQLGDFLHSDGITAVTPTSGHILDQDGRFTKVVRVAVKVLRRVVDMALEKHEQVIVLMAEGNHDISSSIWLRTMFSALYENEPRLTVIDSPLPYYVYRHGDTMLAWHHGHLKKNDELPLLFAAQFPKVWGETTKRYAHTGHRHHLNEKEHSGIKVYQHPTLAARDAYAARGGWIAEREVTAITYHDKFGQHSRVTICPEMLGDEAE